MLKGIIHMPTSFKRVAVVNDEEWLRPASTALSLLPPGEANAFSVRQLDAAKSRLPRASTRTASRSVPEPTCSAAIAMTTI